MACLDRRDICNAIEALLESDSELYGTTGHLNYITDNIVEYDKARVTIDRPYKMFLKAPIREKIATRMGNNADYAIIVEYRIEGLRSNPQTAVDKIDDIDERIDYLIDNEMWTGNNLSSRFTNSESSVTDINTEGSEADVSKDEGGWKVECEGSIRVEINRIKP